MKLVKSLLLGSAAGLAAVAGAQAADLPAKKAAPVEYVRVCSTYGAGFFYIPGTEGCLRVGGQVRADYQYTERLTRADSTIGLYARGRVQLDHRQATAYGLLRTFVRMEIARGSGSRGGGTLVVPGAGGLGSPVTVGPNIAQAFIQFGGLTAGRVTSFFDNADLPMTQMIGLVGVSEAPDTQLLAYTFSFGSGFSATVSLEDPHERIGVSVFPTTGNTLAFSGLNNITGDLNPIQLTQAGYTVPDVVANLKYNGTWGGFQLSGALHQVRDVGAAATAAGFALNTTTGVIAPVAATPGRAPADTDYGFAVRADAYVKLDALSPGDSAWIAATYTDGATGYISGAGGLTAGLASFAASDGVINPYTGQIATTKAWGIAAGFTHYWMPTLRTGVFASYASYDAPGFASTVVAGGTTTNFLAGTTVGFNDGTAWRVGANTFWTPVSGLDIGVEVIYTKVDPRGIVTGRAAGAVDTTLRYVGSDDAFAGRIRVQRTF